MNIILILIVCNSFTRRVNGASISQILDRLLTNYSKKLRPTHELGTPTLIDTNINIKSIGPILEMVNQTYWKNHNSLNFMLTNAKVVQHGLLLPARVAGPSISILCALQPNQPLNENAWLDLEAGYLFSQRQGILFASK